jgi:hypothetical protein
MARRWANRELRTVSRIAGWRDLKALHGWQQAGARRGKRAEPHCARSKSGNVVEFGAGRQKLGFDAFGTTNQSRPGLSEPYTAGVAFEQRLPSFGFQLRDLLRDGRSRVVQLGRGRGNGAGPHDLDEQ